MEVRQNLRWEPANKADSEDQLIYELRDKVLLSTEKDELRDKVLLSTEKDIYLPKYFLVLKKIFTFQGS